MIFSDENHHCKQADWIVNRLLCKIAIILIDCFNHDDQYNLKTEDGRLMFKNIFYQLIELNGRTPLEY